MMPYPPLQSGEELSGVKRRLERQSAELSHKVYRESIGVFTQNRRDVALRHELQNGSWSERAEE